MRSPLLHVRGDRIDDLPVEVEAEVVARGEVGEPAVANTDHASVDLLDDRVGHRVRPLELGEVVDGREPLVYPGRRLQRGPRADPCARSHAGRIDVLGSSL